MGVGLVVVLEVIVLVCIFNDLKLNLFYIIFLELTNAIWILGEGF